MGTEPQEQYFIAKSEGVEATSLSIFFAPLVGRFVVPKEVLRIKSFERHSSRNLWRIITGKLKPQDNTSPVIEPSTVEQVKADLDNFLRTQPPDELFVDESAPEEIVDALQSVQDTLTQESQAVLRNMFGLATPPEFVDDRPHPGLYLKSDQYFI